MNVRLITYEPGQILTPCYIVCTRADHGVTLLCYRTRAAEIEKKHNVNALQRSSICI